MSFVSKRLTAINPLGEKNEINTNEIQWSRYSRKVPDELWDKIPKTSWIVCPRYGRGAYDVQIGITGTVWYGETKKEALVRETQEESGLIISREPKVLLETKITGKDWLWSVCPVESCRPARGRNRNPRTGGRDNRKSKVGVLLYSESKSRLVRKLLTASRKGGMAHLIEDNLLEVVLVPAILAREISENPPTRKVRRQKKLEEKMRLIRRRFLNPEYFDLDPGVDWPEKRKASKRRKKSPKKK